MHNPSNKRIRLSEVLPWLLLLATYLLAITFRIRYGGGMFVDSDMSSEMLLAKALNDSGSILFEKDWFYPSELRAFNQHILFRLGLVLFPNDWNGARLFGQAVLLLLHAVSFIYLMSALGYRKAGVYGAAALMCPFGYWYLFHGIYDGFYITYMIMVSLTVGMIVRLVSPQKEMSGRKKAVLLIQLALFCFMQGLNGVRMLMNLYAPLLLAMAFLLIVRLNQKPMSLLRPAQHRHTRLLMAGLWATAFCLMAFVINSKVLSKSYTYLAQDIYAWDTFSIPKVLETLSMFLALFGYPHDGMLPEAFMGEWESIKLMSIRGVLAAPSIVLMAVVVFAVYRLFKLWNKLSFSHQAVFAVFLSCVAVTGMVYSCLDRGRNGSYWLPIIPLVFAVVIIWIKNESFRLQTAYQYGIGGVLFVCLLCTSTATERVFADSPSRVAPNFKSVVQWVEDHDYRSGYATFWYSNVLTELTDGRVEMRTMVDQDTLQTFKVLQRKSHLNPPEGEFFVLLAEDYYDTHRDSLPEFIQNGTLAYEQDGYAIVVYENMEDLEN